MKSRSLSIAPRAVLAVSGSNLVARLFVRVLIFVAISVVAAKPACVTAQQTSRFDEELVSPFTFRNLGPFRMGARISDIAVPAFPVQEHLYTYYVATWTGGLWKTTNNGTTFEPVFDDQSKLTIGDVTLAPSDPDIVWVGTGDAFTSRSSYAGDGVYKSTDAGETWTNMGLPDSHHIARIVIHPTDPDIVYVASMGHLYSENEERGVFKTTDGGESWEKVFFLNEAVGVIDLILNPLNPDILYAATYDKVRLPWRLINGGPESGIYRTQDGGANWSRLTEGLPRGRIGRIGLDIYPRDPDIVYAVVENANTRPPTPLETAEAEARGRSVREQMVGGEVYRTGDGGDTWRKMNAAEDNVSEKGPYYFSQIRVDPNDDQKIFVTGVTLGSSTDGGRTWHDITWPPRRLFAGIFGDVRTLWIDPENSERIILGSDGGIFVSYDGGQTSDHRYNIPLGEVYAVGVDMGDPYNIYAGLQDHENWKGPSNSARGEITLLDWNAVGNNDGMYTLPDPEDSRWLYTTRQYGGHARIDQRTGLRTEITPRREEGLSPYRFIWATPLHISPHDSRTLYTGGQVLLRSRDRGDTWEELSPDLSTNDTANIFPSSEGGIPGGIPWFAASSIAESPVTPGVIWVGTSDGKVHVTWDDGATWMDRTPDLVAAGAREDAYVSRVRPSYHGEGRAYVTKRGYKFDDFRPFIYRTDDFGATWTPLASNLPQEPINVVWEDRINPDLLFVGNDTGVFVTIDGGGHWVKMNNNMPNVPIHDLLVHPRDKDLVAGSYGRGIFVTDISPLQELDEGVLVGEAHLFSVEPTVQRVPWSFGANDYLFADAHIETRNEPNGLTIWYYLGSPADAPVMIRVSDAAGDELTTMEGDGSPGIHRALWNMRSGGLGGGFGGSGTGGPLDRLAPPGEYQVTLEVGGMSLTQTAIITGTQGWSLGPFPILIR